MYIYVCIYMYMCACLHMRAYMYALRWVAAHTDMQTYRDKRRCV